MRSVASALLVRVPLTIPIASPVSTRPPPADPPIDREGTSRPTARSHATRFPPFPACTPKGATRRFMRVLRKSAYEARSMHIPDAVLAPPVLAATGVVAAAGFVSGLRSLERKLRDRTTVLMGTMSAFVFAAQMVKFPVGPGVAGHLMGGVLAAVLLGPWAGAVVIGAVLIVQCLLFQDGGLEALGANFLNMGPIGSVVGYAIYAPIRRALGGRAGVLVGAMAAAWFS